MLTGLELGFLSFDEDTLDRLGALSTGLGNDALSASEVALDWGRSLSENALVSLTKPVWILVMSREGAGVEISLLQLASPANGLGWPLVPIDLVRHRRYGAVPELVEVKEAIRFDENLVVRLWRVRMR